MARRDKNKRKGQGIALTCCLYGGKCQNSGDGFLNMLFSFGVKGRNLTGQYECFIISIALTKEKIVGTDAEQEAEFFQNLQRRAGNTPLDGTKVVWSQAKKLRQLFLCITRMFPRGLNICSDFGIDSFFFRIVTPLCH